MNAMHDVHVPEPISNRLLLSLCPKTLERLRPDLELVPLRRGQVIDRVDGKIENLHFVNRGLVSLVKTMHDHNKRLRRLATTLGSGLIDLVEVFRDRDDCFEDLVHFKTEKRVDKAAAIAMALWKAGIVRKR